MMKKHLYFKLFLSLFLFVFLFPLILVADAECIGDLNGDLQVNYNDLVIFAMAYRATPGSANWNPVCDLNVDGSVSYNDLVIFAMHYRDDCRGSSDWTVMVYLDGDNTLDYYAWDDLSEMESIGSSNEINIITQVDLYNSCSGTYRYFVTGAEQGSTYPLYSNDIVQKLLEQNMADPAVLNNFINWGINNYPADHYILILWDHGGGWREESIFMKGIIVDETSNDFLTMAELVQGLENIEEPLDIIGFDACLMQMVEVYYEIGSSITSPSPPRYGIGSEESEWGNGWPYDLILGDLTSNPSMSESTLCEIIVNDYISNCGSVGTLSALYFSPEITQSTEVLNAIDSFANALMNSTYQTEINSARSSAQSYSYPDYKDLYDFAQKINDNVPDSDCQSKAQAVMDLINSVIVAEGHTGPGMDNSHGLSIYLPDYAGEYDNDYNDLQFAIDTQWDEFLQGGGVVPPSSVYRAFLVGVGDYQYFPDVYGNYDLSAPPFDVDMMHNTLSHSGSGFSSINELIDLQATKTAILNGIATAFSGADSDDVSYFYFNGHGMNYNGVSYLCPTDISYYSLLSSFISTNELGATLSAVPGTKVVILDCCHSGGFIGKQMQEEEIFTNPQDFNNNVINVFLSSDLTGSQYKVLTACLSSQVSWELIPVDEDPFGLFSGALCEGCGYDSYTHPYPADGNGNSEITLDEAYAYTYGRVNEVADYLNALHPDWNIHQDTQVYPLNSDFIIIEE